MSDYIKREDAIERLSYHADFYQNDREFGGEEMLYKDSALNEILELSSADVVEVVRCKDCKHKPNGYTDDDVLRYPNFPHEENNPCPCQVYEDEWYSWIPKDDFYCSYGERADT